MTAKQKIFWLRLVTLIGLCLPALDLAWRWYGDDLGARPVTQATHIHRRLGRRLPASCSLALTPARGVYDWMPLVQIRRRIGVAAALYAGLHFLIYVARPEMGPRRGRAGDREALLPHDRLRGSAGAGGAGRSPRPTAGSRGCGGNGCACTGWSIRPPCLAILHFFIQSKANVGEATVAAGLFAWLMIWRWMPADAALAPGSACCCSRRRDPGCPGLRDRMVRAGESSRRSARVLKAASIPTSPRPTQKVLLASLTVIVPWPPASYLSSNASGRRAISEGLYRPPEWRSCMSLSMKRREWLGLRARERPVVPERHHAHRPAAWWSSPRPA